jgi:hypothetical protein
MPMNVKIDVDITPEEMRKLLGLPDVESFQREMLEDIRKKMLEGAEGYDPLKLFQPYLSGSMASWDMFQKMFSAAVAPRTEKGDPGERC